MKKILKVIIICSLVLSTLQATQNEAKRLCDAEIQKEVIDKVVVKEQCIKTAKFYKLEKVFGNASWYYLLGKDNKYNIEKLYPNIENYTGQSLYSNIAHSYILQHNISKAKELYIKFLKKADIPWADNATQDDYKLLVKLYPNQKEDLKKGLKLWNEIYKPLLAVNELYPKYKKARKDKKYTEAIKYITQVINLQKQLNLQNEIKIAQNEYNLGIVYNYNKQYKKSLNILHKVEIVYRKVKSKKKDLATLLSWIADGYENLQENTKSLNYFKKSLAIREKVLGVEHTSTATSYNSLGELYYKMGDYPKSLNYFKKSLAIREKVLGVEHTSTATSYNNIGSLYKSMGDYPKSLNYFKKSLAINEKVLGVEHTSTATSYNSLGGLYYSMGDYPKSLNYYKKSLAINEKVLGVEHTSTATSYNNIGLLYDSMGDYPKSLNYFKKSLAISEKVLGVEHTSTARSYNNIGLLYDSMGDYPKALNYYKKSLAINEKVLGVEHTSTAISYNNIGGLYKRMKKYNKAYKYAKLSYNNFIINRDKNFAILNNKQKKLYLKSNSHQVPLLLITAYLYSSDTNQTMTQKDKKSLYSTTLSDWLNYKGAIYDSENTMITLYENTKDQEVKDKIDSLMQSKRKLAQLYQTLPKTKQERKTYQQRIKDNIKEITDIENYISSKASSFKEELGLRTISYKDISKNLKEDELYIDYAKAGNYYYIFTLDNKDNITFNQVNKNDTKSIDKNVKAFRKDIDTILNNSKLTEEDMGMLKSNSKKRLSSLYELTLHKPLKEILSKYSNLIISTDGALRLLPFETMYNTTTNKYLIQEKNIRYIPSGKELVRLYRQTPTDTKEKIVLFSNPNFNAKGITLAKVDTLNTSSTNRAGIVKSLFKMRFIALPGTKEEVKNIKQTLNTTKTIEYTQDEAKEENLLKIDTPKILHIATHGFFINDDNIPNPMLKSGIALSGANASAILGKSDGIVTSLKLSGLNLKGTELVVLSACQTGVVDINSTENVSGLNKAFIQAGAKNIVMSLWSVADKETSDLMSGFYKEMKNTPDYAQALRNSKLKMIKEDLHPFYWGAFVVSGS